MKIIERLILRLYKMKNKEHKNILAIDTSSSKLILGLSFGGDRLVKSDETIEKSHGQLLIKKISELLKSADIKIEDLDAIIVNIGPGSFTGLRIGLSAAKGMAVALNLKIAAVNLFEIAELRLKNIDKEISVLVPFKKGHHFILPVTNRVDLNNIKTISDDELTNMKSQLVAAFHLDLKTFSGFNIENDYSKMIKYDASDLIQLGMKKIIENKTEKIDLLEPLYIQKSQAEINYDKQNRK